MAVQSFSIIIDQITIHKFKSLKSGLSATPDKRNSLNIIPQVHEISIYESIFEPILKCEIAIIDYIGLFTNFPLTGEEIVVISYRNVGDDGAVNTREWTFAIDEIKDIAIKDDNRALSYMISCISIEALANSIGTVQKAYRGTPIQISKRIFEENIIKRIQEFYPGYRTPNIYTEDNATDNYALVIPNMHPIAAIDMVNDLTYSQVPDKYTYLFYQSINNVFNFRTLQGLISAPNARRNARRNSYKFFSDEIAEVGSNMQNETRIVSKLAFNRRHSSLQKVAAGYFNNKLFEINIAQKAVHSTPTRVDDSYVSTMTKYPFNTTEYTEWAQSYDDPDEKSNRTKYVVTTRPEHDPDFILPKMRDRWGKDLISKIALNQVDVTAVIPGTNRFGAGDLFYLEIPEFDGFENLEEDDFVSGMYIITEIKHIINMGGYQSTVLKLNKDTYEADPNRESKYIG